MTLPFALCVVLLSTDLLAQPVPQGPLPTEGYRPGIEVERYQFSIALSDTTDRIEGVATMDVRLTSDTLTVFPLDLVAETGGRGMSVSAVTQSGRPVAFTHSGDRLNVSLSASPAVGDLYVFEITYSGVPGDGLIIGENRHGRRTFFGDNWPNRARHWLPSVDHPSHKAFVDWTVTAPAHYRVIANGRLREDSDQGNGTRITRYAADGALPMKVVVIGVAEFAVDVPAVINHVPVESWVYPEDRNAGFADFARAERVLQVFESLLGPYPYAKLANVQSTTRYGGMENAGAIFYDESRITGTGDIEALLAHEIAHQWFGNDVSERDWPHVWLSEGFATYLTHVYMEMTYGEDERARRMAADRNRVVAFARQHPNRSMVDSTYIDPTDLLNTNSYQRGGWVLHMLRRHIGDESFFAGLRDFHAQYRGRNADTEEFRRVMERTSGGDLADFFRRWVYQPGVPDIEASWQVDDSGLLLDVNATPGFLPVDLEVTVVTDFGEHTHPVRLTSPREEFRLSTTAEVRRLVLDLAVNVMANLSLATPETP